MNNNENSTFSEETHDFVENEAFITIVKVVNDPDQGAEEIRKILKLGSVERTGVIDRMVAGMKKDGVNKMMIEAVELLKNDSVVNIIIKEFLE